MCYQMIFAANDPLFGVFCDEGDGADVTDTEEAYTLRCEAAERAQGGAQPFLSQTRMSR